MLDYWLFPDWNRMLIVTSFSILFSAIVGFLKKQTKKKHSHWYKKPLLLNPTPNSIKTTKTMMIILLQGVHWSETVADWPRGVLGLSDCHCLAITDFLSELTTSAREIFFFFLLLLLLLALYLGNTFFSSKENQILMTCFRFWIKKKKSKTNLLTITCIVW